MHGLIMNYALTVPAILRHAETLYGAQEIVTRRVDKTIHRYTYADFIRRAKKLAVALQRLGIRPGDRVATLCWNQYQHLEAYFGVTACGAVLHTLNLRLAADDLIYIANHADDRAILVDETMLPLLAQIRPELRTAHYIAIMQDGPAPEGMLDYEQLLSGADETGFAYPDLDENAAAAMCYTSGTTGRPKGVVYSHRAIALHSLAISLPDALSLGERDVVMPVVPMFHVNAWGLPYAAVMVGAKQVLPGRHLDAESLLELCEQEQVTLSGGVPTVWFPVLAALDYAPGRRHLAPGLRIGVGGAASPRALIEGFDRHGGRILALWGMTETTPIATIATPSPALDCASGDEQYYMRTKAGRQLPFIEVRVRGEQGLVPWDDRTMGELEIRGAWVLSGYYNAPGSEERFTPDGWFRTGDIATIDSLGYVVVRDRSKDLVKSGGEWISSVDLEKMLVAHPAVAEAAVIAVSHPVYQERPLAIVVLKEGQQATPEELRAFLAPHFAKWWLPDAFAFVPQIPHTGTGKILKSALRAQFADRLGTLDAPEQTANIP